MPQIDQFADALYSQAFWLLLVIGIIYFGIGHFMVPKIMATMDSRDTRISEDLAAAESARNRADEVEEAYRVRMNDSRSEVLKVIQAAKQESARATEGRMAEVDAATRARLEEAEDRLRAAAQSAMAELETVAAEAAREMVERLAGLQVSEAEAIAAVKSEAIRG